MLISRTGIKILFLLIIVICCQITTKNNTSLYLQPVYAQPNDSRKNQQSDPIARSNLLAAIREGIKLKKVDKGNNKNSKSTSSAKNINLASILARRVALEPSDTEESDGKSDDDSDNDWNDKTESVNKQNSVPDNHSEGQKSTSSNNHNTVLNNQDSSSLLLNGNTGASSVSSTPAAPSPLLPFPPVEHNRNHNGVTQEAKGSSSSTLNVGSEGTANAESLPPPINPNLFQKAKKRIAEAFSSTINIKGAGSHKSNIDISSSGSTTTSNTHQMPSPPPPPPLPLSILPDGNTSANSVPLIPIYQPLPPPLLGVELANARAETTSGSQVSGVDQQGEVLPPPATQTEDDDNYDNTLPPPPTDAELANARAETTSGSQVSGVDQQGGGGTPPLPLKKDQATQTEDFNTIPQTNSMNKEKIEDDENDSLAKPGSFGELQKNTVINYTNATPYNDTSRAIIHYTSIPMRVVNNFISRKTANSNNSSHVRYVGASESNSILHQKKYELECKYVYNATTIPQKNVLGKASLIGTIINLKYQFSSKLTGGMFYAPTITTYTTYNQSNNNTIAAATEDNIINHCIGVYTSYAITPATYLSNQVSVGFSITNDNNRDKNNSKKHGHPHYFTVDSFVNHKTKIDATKTISPFLGLSYYSANPRLCHNIGNINNLSLVIGVKFQYEYKYKDLVVAPWLKLTHARSIYSNISTKIQDKSITAQGEPLIDLLRDFHTAFNPSSSVTLALSMRRRALRFAAGYEYSIHHECDNSYSHTFFARINITF